MPSLGGRTFIASDDAQEGKNFALRPSLQGWPLETPEPPILLVN